MGFVSRILGGWYGYAAAAGIAALLLVPPAVFLTGMSYRLTISNMQRDSAQKDSEAASKALSQFEADAQGIHEAAASFSIFQTDLNKRFGAISQDFHNAIKAHPLPADCEPGADRVRALYSAISAANTDAGRKPLPAVPARP